jgi:hypothetical protein
MGSPSASVHAFCQGGGGANVKKYIFKGEYVYSYYRGYMFIYLSAIIKRVLMLRQGFKSIAISSIHMHSWIAETSLSEFVISVS